VLGEYHLGHDVAHSKGGSTSPRNMRAVHASCNLSMGTGGFPAAPDGPAMKLVQARRVLAHWRNPKKPRPTGIMGLPPLPRNQPRMSAWQV